jgi:hypothetical protein
MVGEISLHVQPESPVSSPVVYDQNDRGMPRSTTRVSEHVFPRALLPRRNRHFANPVDGLSEATRLQSRDPTMYRTTLTSSNRL